MGQEADKLTGWPRTSHLARLSPRLYSLVASMARQASGHWYSACFVICVQAHLGVSSVPEHRNKASRHLYVGGGLAFHL